MKPKNSYKKEEFFSVFYERNLELTRLQVKNSVTYDVLIVHTINNLIDIMQVINMLIKDLREWYEIYAPEFSKAVKEHEMFVESIVKKSKEELLIKLGIKKDDSIGADLSERDVSQIKVIGKAVIQLYTLKKQQESYLESLMSLRCPNLKEVAEIDIGARLLRHAGSLKNLMEMPASKIQLLGAEKSLFRHMKSGSKSPKFGMLFQHPLLQKIDKKKQGKCARALADKIAIAVKVDYFNGEFIGDKLRNGLEVRFGK